MYESWLYSRWETPASDADVLMMEFCTHDANLELILDMSTESIRRDLVKFAFYKCPAFRYIQETYRTELWGMFSKNGYPGRTFFVDNSPWIKELSDYEVVFDAVHGKTNFRHYVIATDWYVVELLASTPPIISTVPAEAFPHHP